MKPPVSFRLIEDTPLDVLKFQLDNFVHHTDYRKVVKIDYRSPSIDNEGKIRFSKFERKTNEDLKVMWNTYHR